MDMNRSDRSTARQLAPRNAVAVDVNNIARSRKPIETSLAPLKSVKHQMEQRLSSTGVYVSVWNIGEEWIMIIELDIIKAYQTSCQMLSALAQTQLFSAHCVSQQIRNYEFESRVEVQPEPQRCLCADVDSEICDAREPRWSEQSHSFQPQTQG